MNNLPVGIDDIIVDPKTYASEDVYHSSMRALRNNDPVHWSTPTDYRPFWAVTRHADILNVELNAKNFINEPRQFLITTTDEENLVRETGDMSVARTLIRMDGADHRAYRSMTSAWFGPKHVKKLEDQIHALAVETVDRMFAAGGQCDFASDIAAYFPLRTIMLVLGVPREDEALMLRLSKKLFGGTDVDVGGGTSVVSMVEAFREFSEYFDGVTADRRKNPRNDVATVLANATVDGQPIGERERNSYYLIVAAAGHDTTSSSISGGLLALLQNPAELEKIRNCPQLIHNAVDEIIRWVSPVKHFFRTAVNDADVGGQRIKAGDSLMMCYPSANRDATVFVEPDRFMVDRKNAKSHIAFGYGPHLCLGNALAKTQIRFLFEELLGRVSNIQLDGRPSWVETNFVSGLKSLPIKFTV